MPPTEQGISKNYSIPFVSLHRSTTGLYYSEGGTTEAGAPSESARAGERVGTLMYRHARQLRGWHRRQ